MTDAEHLSLQDFYNETTFILIYVTFPCQQFKWIYTVRIKL